MTEQENTSAPTAKDALQAIANLPTGANEDVMRGQEEAYRAVEALFDVAPKVHADPAPVTQTEAQPFAWYWHDRHGCLYITGDDRKPEVPAGAKPLYEQPPQEQTTGLLISSDGCNDAAISKREACQNSQFSPSASMEEKSRRLNASQAFISKLPLLRLLCSNMKRVNEPLSSRFGRRQSSQIMDRISSKSDQTSLEISSSDTSSQKAGYLPERYSGSTDKADHSAPSPPDEGGGSTCG